MPIERRNALKLIAFSPLYLLGLRALGLRTGSDIYGALPGGAAVNLVFHGFFFFEVQDGALVVGAPYNQDHNYLYRDQGEEELHEIDDKTISYPELATSPSMPVWPDALMNFSKTSAGLKRPVISQTFNSKLVGCLMVLPYPKNVAAIRFGGTTDEFKLEGNIASHINLPSDKNLGLATCLQYDTDKSLDFDARHYYAEHCVEPGNTGLQSLMNSARTAFGSPFKEAFDLTMTQTKRLPKENLLKYEEERRKMAKLSDDDYNDLAALKELRYVKHNPCRPFETPEDRLPVHQRRSHEEEHGKGSHSHPFLVRTANCPQFAMLP